MNDQGYTLAETLAALVMIGLAAGGLTMGIRVIGHGEALAAGATSDGRGLRSVQAALGALLDNRGPFRTKDGATFEGSSDRFSFACNGKTSCSAALRSSGAGTALEIQHVDGRASRLTIPGSGPLHFEYVGYQGEDQAWPPPAPTSDVLRSVLIVRNADGTPVATGRVWREQPTDCAFDPVSGDCRRVTP